MSSKTPLVQNDIKKDLDEENPIPNDDPKTATFTTAPPPSFSKILALARPEFFALFISLLLMILAEGTYLFNPILIAKAYDALVQPYSLDVTPTTKMSEINRVMILVVILQACAILAGFLRSTIMGVVGERVVARLRTTLYSRILSQEIAFFDSHKTGELVSRLTSDTTLLQQATSFAVPEVVIGATKACVCLALMFWISAPLTGVTIGAVVAIFLMCIPFGKKIGELSKAYQDALGKAQNSSTEALGSMRTVQAFAMEDKERRRYNRAIGNPMEVSVWSWFGSFSKRTMSETTYGVGVAKAIWSSGFYTILFGFGFGMLNISLWLGFKLVVDGEISLGELTAFQSYIFSIGAGLGTTSRYVTQLLEAKGASARIFQLLEREPVIKSPSSDNTLKETKKTANNVSSDLELVNPTTLTGDINFSDVSFAYPSRPDTTVLSSFRLTIPANSTVALVGVSGSGKSTVVSLLQRFYDVRDGSITIDGRDLRTLDLKWLRRQIGYVEQEPQLFGLTVRENVAYGIEDYNGESGGDDDRAAIQERIEAACKLANAHDFIVNSLGDGYDTLVGERGVKLSGGQKQRIAIARAVLVDPRILLLDEATSALDSESEYLVQDALDNAIVGRTVLIIAHRLSTVRDANQIVVLKDHQIVDVGTHNELIDRCDHYRELIKRQQSAAPEKGDGHGK